MTPLGGRPPAGGWRVPQRAAGGRYGAAGRGHHHRRRRGAAGVNGHLLQLWQLYLGLVSYRDNRVA